MSSKYYTVPGTLSPNTTARSAYFNAAFQVAMLSAFENTSGVGVAGDMVKTLSHATLPITPVAGAAGALAGKLLAMDGTGLALVTGVSFGTYRGTWVTATAYMAGDLVAGNLYPFNLYYVSAGYTSGASVAADVTANHLNSMTNLSAVGVQSPIVVYASGININAVKNTRYLLNLDAGSNVTISLPGNGGGQQAGDYIEITMHPNFTKAITAITGGGSNLNGNPSNAVLYPAGNTLIRNVRLYWSGSNTIGWVIG